jgi:Fe-S-cluster-containing dehydrogenase component
MIVIYFNQDLKIAQKCTGCAHLLDRGWRLQNRDAWDICSRKVLRFGEESEFSVR